MLVSSARARRAPRVRERPGRLVLAGLFSIAMGIVRNGNGTFALGNVSNPSGINQWTRRREIDQLWYRLLDEVDVERGGRESR